MNRNLTAFLSFLLIVFAIFWSLYGILPRDIEPVDAPKTSFSTERAFQHVEKIAQEPHYLGSENHSIVRNYIVKQLQEMGLFVQTQEGYALNKYGVVAKPQNILTRIEGSGEGDALLLLTHYDSAMHSSYGASDAASGVATILEGIRAFLETEKKHENDIIIVFTDAEELGLNGAELFVNDHPWAKDVKLALNFESRGSGGASFMLLETTEGNAEMIKAFSDADLQFPVTNSLAYSIYKMLPNDTDLTVLREQGKINGFNFAFIDDHFDYHTATDIPENLDLETLAHQGSYLMPLLNYFSNNNLEKIHSAENVVFFNFPLLKMVHYPYSWIIPLLLFTLAIFIITFIFGIKKGELSGRGVLKGFVPLLGSITLSAIVIYVLWQACLLVYPQYGEMEHGFTYNGYNYIASAIFLSLAISFFVYKKYANKMTAASLFVAPLIFWLLLSIAAAFFLKGASYFVIPVLFGLLQLFLLIKQERPNILLLAILCLPAIFIAMPFVPRFPVALGLKLLFSAGIMSVLLLVLLLPVFLFLKKFRSFGLLCWITSFVFFVVAHFQSDFNEERPKPNSLVYILDADTNSASWNTYDELLDPWTKNYLGEDPQKAQMQTAFSSKYNSGLKYTVPAQRKNIPKPDIFITKIDSLQKDEVVYKLKIASNRNINRIDFFAGKKVDFQDFKVNNEEALPFEYKGEQYHVFKNRMVENLLTYYVSNRDTLRLEMKLKKGDHPELIMYETSHDLFSNDQFSVPKRPDDMIPRPFVINDAIIIKKTIKLE